MARGADYAGRGAVVNGRGVVQDRPVFVIDDFEDNDIAEYGGETGAFSVVTSPVYNGSYAIQGTGGANYYISDTGTLQHPEPGDTFEYYTRCSSTNWRGGMLFATQSEDSTPGGYMPHINWGNSDMVLGKDSAEPHKNILATKAITVASGEWYRVETSWGGDGTIAVTTERLSNGSTWSLSVSDSTYTSGGIGWYVNDGGNSINYTMDYAHTI